MKPCQLIQPEHWRGVLAGVGLALAAGCATNPSAPPANFVFYPPPPAPPRLQFLVSYSSAEDVIGQRTKFTSFVVGDTPQQQPIFKPYGLALKDGQLHVCDTVIGAIHVYDLKKRQTRYFRPKGQGQLRVPVNLVIDRDGTRYVVDTGRNQVLLYGADDRYLGAIGKRGEFKPTDVAVGPDRLYVTDLQGHCVRVYDKSAQQLLFTVPRDTNSEPARLFLPTNLALDSQGRLYVSDTGGFRVQQYDAAGQYLRTFGGHGDSPGEFARPKGVAVDRADRLYVVDAATQVVQIFDAQGRLLLFFGEPGSSDFTLTLPAQVILDYDNVDLFQRYAAPDFELEYLVLVVSQYGEHKVSVFGFGHQR